MTTDNIIKTLEHCVSGQGCKTCPARADGKPCGMSLRAILDVIHELTEKINNLDKEDPKA